MISPHIGHVASTWSLKSHRDSEPACIHAGEPAGTARVPNHRVAKKALAGIVQTSQNKTQVEGFINGVWRLSPCAVCSKHGGTGLER